MVCHKIGIFIYKLQFPRLALSSISGEKAFFPLKTEKNIPNIIEVFQIFRKPCMNSIVDIEIIADEGSLIKV